MTSLPEQIRSRLKIVNARDHALITAEPPSEFMATLPSQKNPAVHGMHVDEVPSWMPFLQYVCAEHEGICEKSEHTPAATSEI